MKRNEKLAAVGIVSPIVGSRGGANRYAIARPRSPAWLRILFYALPRAFKLSISARRSFIASAANRSIGLHDKRPLLIRRPPIFSESRQLLHPLTDYEPMAIVLIKEEYRFHLTQIARRLECFSVKN